MSGGVKGNTPWPAARLKRTTGCVHNEAPTSAKLATNRELQRLRMGVERDVEIIIGFIQVGTINERSDGSGPMRVPVIMAHSFSVIPIPNDLVADVISAVKYRMCSAQSDELL